MAKDAYVLPLYQKPTCTSRCTATTCNIRNNPTLDGQTYNIAEWGLKAS